MLIADSPLYDIGPASFYRGHIIFVRRISVTTRADPGHFSGKVFYKILLQPGTLLYNRKHCRP